MGPHGARSTGHALTARVLHFGFSVTLGYVAREQLNALRELGWETHAACPQDTASARLSEDGFAVHPIDLPHRAGVRDGLRGASQFWKLLERERFDLIHTHNAHNGVIGRVLARVRGIPSVHTWRYSPLDAADGPIERGVYFGAEATASRAGNFVCFQNPDDLDLAVSSRIVRRNQAFLVGNGIDVDRYQHPQRPRETTRASLGSSADARIVLCVARFAERKHVEDVVSAFSMISQDLPNARLVLVGEGERESKLRAQVAQLGLAERVVFTGHRNDVADVLAASDVLCLASRREGIPRAVMEAMAAGCPVVATDVVGTKTLLEHRRTGLLAPFADPAALSASVLEVLRDLPLAESLRQNARIEVERNWSQGAVAERVSRIYERCLGAAVVNRTCAADEALAVSPPAPRQSPRPSEVAL